MDEQKNSQEGDFLEKFKWSISFLLLGAILVGMGVLGSNIWTQREGGIEIISSEEARAGEIFVDLRGAVEKPGVYQLSVGSRLNELLIAAGGLSQEADREWVAKNLNLAAKLEDEAKIYVLKVGEKEVSGEVAGVSAGKININTASSSELESLSGIGPTYAQKIIDNRPYQKIEDILEIPGIGQKTFERIKDRLSVW
jgi:competence protein ComEA